MSEPINSSKKVLIVEDEAPLRNALRDTLLHENFAVLEAKDGKEGLGIALSEKPDVIILDLVMPVMDGQTMLKHLREDEAYGKDAQVIVLSNTGIFTPQSKEVNMGTPAFYLTKSNFGIDQVVAKVKAVIANVERRSVEQNAKKLD